MLKGTIPNLFFFFCGFYLLFFGPIILLILPLIFKQMPEVDKMLAVLSQLEEKMLAELQSGHPYEALQYVQSFVARKKKLVGQNVTSALVFRGVKLMVDNNASSSAGTLLCWFIEEGAGLENT